MRSQGRWDHGTPDPVDPPDDWVNGSWTVDCVCGVNFDDGEEMVDCDECGVWVHTRCSRYVKSEKSFACDKCKTSKNKKDCETVRIEEEEAETEVAQLLVDLPTKTMRRGLGNPIPSGGFRKRLWSEIPMEEKVHVQGIPGGDIGIFSNSGLSSVFGPQLWKSTGYVPKKFNFQYKEFACWNEGNENPANNGDANAVVLLDKVAIPMGSQGLGAGTKTQVEESKKKGESEDVDGRIVQHNGMKKDKSPVHPTMIHYGKRKKEDSHTSKDVNGKKKARVRVEGEDTKKRSSHTSKSASTPSSDAKLSECRGSRVTGSGKHRKLKGNMTDDPSLKHIQRTEVDDPKNTLPFNGKRSETSCVLSTHRISLIARRKDEYDVRTSSFQNSSKISDSVQLVRDHNESRSLPANTEDVVAVDNVSQRGRVGSRSDRIKLEHPVKYLENVAPQVIDSRDDQDSDGKMSLSCLNEDKAQVDINDSRGSGSLPQHNAHVLTKVEGIDNVQSIDHKIEDVDRNAVDADCESDKAGAPSAAVLSHCDRHLVGSDSSQVAMENSVELKQVTHSEDQLESCETTLISSEELTKRKMVVSFGKSSSTTLLSKCLTSDSRRGLDAQNFNGSIKQNVASENKTISKNDNSSAGFVKDRESYEKPKKIPKELPKSSTSAVKTSSLSKVPISSISTKTLSESKESSGLSSAKPSLAQDVSASSMPDESPSSFQLDGASCADNKTTASTLMQRTDTVNHDTVNHLNSQSSLKASHTPQMHHSAASSAPATLSDEELALLLHHELNSSPRVPRVPRMRHAGSLPQLASPTGANMLMKRSSSSVVGKDHGLVFKRKGKSIAKEETQTPHELPDESKDVKKSSLLPSQSINDSAHGAVFVTNREAENGSAPAEQSGNKSIPRATTLTVGSASSTATEHSERNAPSTFKSQNASDGNTGADVRPTHRTLPGLLSEIMNKRMTYEELCNAVLPHWPYLRKHNGERYAYSSHSQAVLDCLRNRSEWARLVDRGPKTNAGRKRRRSDAEAPSFESEDKEGTTENAEGVAQFPKGKRKARKRRRRLSLQGRGLKNMATGRGRKQKKADDVSYDDACSLSSSSSAGESSMSEDETIQEGGGTSSAAGHSETSASSE